MLRQIAFELNETLSGGFINKIHQPLAREIVLRVRTREKGEKRLMISADPLLGRIHLTSLKIPNPPSPLRFCAFLRAHLQGGMITEISCAADDRVVRIATVRGPSDKSARRDLILELLGRDSNLIVVDRASGMIMECLHRIPQKESGARVVLPRVRYEPPPARPQPSDGRARQWEGQQVRPGIIRPESGRRKLVLWATPGEDELFPSVNEAADAFYSPRLKNDLLGGLRRQLAAPLKSRIRSLENRLLKIEADRERSERFAAGSEDGELLKANLGMVKKGMNQVEVKDWTTGSARVITLDPALDGVANMQRLFKRAAKGKRGERMVNKRLQETTEEKLALEDLLFFVDHAQDVEELNALGSEIPSYRLGAVLDEPRDKPHKPLASDAFLRRFKTPSGRDVLVGKSGKGNDRLLREKARNGDLWFHVKGIPGTHVLLPRRERDQVTHEEMEFAAGLAAWFSRARGKGPVDVIAADVKDLRRPTGALPGQVTVGKHTTLRVEASEPKGE